MTVEACERELWEGVSVAARRLAVDSKAVKQWVEEGTLVGRLLPGRKLRIARSSVDALLQSSLVKPTAARGA